MTALKPRLESILSRQLLDILEVGIKSEEVTNLSVFILGTAMEKQELVNVRS